MTEIASDAINELAAALAKAQALMTNPKKDKTAKVKTRTGNDYEYKYSDLASVRDIVIPILAANDIAVIQFTEVIAAGMLLHTRFVHSSGQWIESTYPIVVGDRPQDVGSAISYGRRYCLSSMCGIASEEDDDAQISQGAGAWAPAKPPTNQRHIYATLAESIRSLTSEAAYAEWKNKHGHEVEALDETYFTMLQQVWRDHKGTLKPPVSNGTAKKAGLAERAIAAEKEANAPMPDDEVPF